MPIRDCFLTVSVDPGPRLVGFGSARPTTDESVTGDKHRTYLGRALAVIRRLENGSGEVTVSAHELPITRIHLLSAEPRLSAGDPPLIIAGSLMTRLECTASRISSAPGSLLRTTAGWTLE